MSWIAFAAVCCLAGAWLADHRRRIYADLETIPAAAVYAGRNEVKGRAWHPEPTLAHHSRTPCISWSYRLEEQRKHTRKTENGTTTSYQWHTIERLSSGRDHLELIDDSGSVRVVLDRATVDTRQLTREEFRVDDPRSFFEKLFTFGPNRTGKYRHIESGIAIGDELFVTGEASLRADVIEPQLDHGQPFVVSTRSERSHRGWTGGVAVVLAIAGIVLAGYAGEVVNPSWGPVAGGSAAVVVIVLGLLLTLYNRLQLQVQSAARAWSLIDVQLARRHDLIPQLAAVARGLIDHERVLLESLATTRTSLAGAPPTSATVARADHEAGEQTGRITHLLALIEAYPDLKADEAMLTVQRQIADAENRIAGTRRFYNDSVTLLRTQRRTFPGLLVARFADQRRFALFAAEGFDRTVPPIEFDWNVGR